MKVEVNQKDFYQAINIVRKAVSTKTTLPILSGILLKTEGQRLRLVGTDLEMGIEAFVEAEIIEEGEVVLPAIYFANIIKELPNEKVDLEISKDNNTAFIKCGYSKFNINGSPADEFPSLPKVKSGKSFKIKEGRLKEIFGQVEFAISKDESKPFLNGGLLLFEEDKIKLVATDTYRLAYREDSIEELDIEGDAIVPSNTISEIAKLLNDSEDLVEVVLTENQILFNFAGITMVSRLIEGQFPNYKQVIPKNSKTKVEVDRMELLRATKRAALLARQDADIIKINLKEDRLVITANAPEVGQAYEEVSISLLGQETEIAFNANYLVDCLKAMKDETVNVELSGSLAPGVIKRDSDDYVYVIMPVRSA
ncbi:DNA polymerase III subunit beta [Halonatronum saccharophilum]|uniref:DNA polymerase III subunit beta n=1 Tax=Halonatronum saccharophilum TaxID=150060 RepID=UPI0004896889|nr:DNA polymerase III subunit beta [Halonatronum saccharophilum]